MTRAGLLLGLAACGSHPAAPPPAPPSAPAAADFQLDWSPPCRVPVTDTETRNDASSVTLEYDLAVTPADDGTWIVDRRDVRFMAVDGEPVGGQLAEELRIGGELLELLPEVRIDSAGNIRGSGSPMPYLERMHAWIAGNDPAALEMLRPHQDSLVVRRGVQTVQENLWAACVANWTAWQGTPGVSNEIPSAEIFGTAVDGTTRLEDLSRTDGRAHLRVSIDASGPGATPLVTELLMDHAPLADPSTLDVSEVSFRSVREVVIDPTNLRPDRASYVVEMHATIGGTPRTRTEGHDLRFDWANATGCGR